MVEKYTMKKHDRSLLIWGLAAVAGLLVIIYSDYMMLEMREGSKAYIISQCSFGAGVLIIVFGAVWFIRRARRDKESWKKWWYAIPVAALFAVTFIMTIYKMSIDIPYIHDPLSVVLHEPHMSEAGDYIDKKIRRCLVTGITDGGQKIEFNINRSTYKKEYDAVERSDELMIRYLPASRFVMEIIESENV